MSACQCSGCGLWLNADVPAGQPVRCPRCQTAFTGEVPGAAAAATLAPAPASVSAPVSASVPQPPGGGSAPPPPSVGVGGGGDGGAWGFWTWVLGGAGGAVLLTAVAAGVV